MTNIPVKFRVQRINEALTDLKPDFEAYIKDQDFPLEERWRVFKDAPDQLSNHDQWLHDFNDEYAQDAKDRLGNAPETCGRGKRINIPEWVDEEILENIEPPNEEPYLIKGTYDRNPKWVEKTEEDWKKANEALNPLREEILQKNLKSFCFDW